GPQRRPGYRGDHRRVDVDDVDAVTPDEGPQLADPAGVKAAPDAEARACHTECLEGADHGMRPFDQVGGEVLEPVAVGGPGVCLEEAFHAPGPEPLRQPQHPSHQNSSMSPSTRARSPIAGTPVRLTGFQVSTGPRPAT